MFNVLVDARKEDSHWIYMVRWLECAVGIIGEDWDCYNYGNDTIYVFRRERHAVDFEQLWNTENNFTIIPYPVWDHFCINSLYRGRMDAYWRRVGWRPETVLLDDTKPSHQIDGGRRVYRGSQKAWFFEFYTDALVHWMNTHG